MFLEYDNAVTDDVVELEYKRTHAWGEEVLINLYDCELEKMQSKEYIAKFIKELVDFIDMKAYGEPMIELFGEGDLFGYSAVQLIYTSCITMHFSDVDRRIFIDIFSCRNYKPKATIGFCIEKFGAGKGEYKTILRD